METLYLILLILSFVVGITYIRLGGGITKHIYFAYTLAVYFLFLIIPSYFYWKLEKFEELGVSIQTVFAQGVLYYCIGIICFVYGYIAVPSSVDRRPLIRQDLFFSNKWMLRITLFFMALSLVVQFSHLDTSGSFITYVWTTLDFLITLTIALYIRDIKKVWFIILLAVSVTIFSIYFFRYRIYLTLMGIGAVYVYHNPDIFSKIWRYLGIGFVLLYMVLFFTINKSSLAALNFEDISFNVIKLDEGGTSAQNIFLEQGSNLHTDFTVLKYYIENADAQHDFGLTMFIYPFVRALPSTLFASGVKPYPAPAMQVIVDAYGGDTQAEHAGRFVTNLFEFYIAFGVPGIIVGMFLFGAILKYLQNRWVWDDGYNSIIQIAIMVSLFQYISRGYFPQYINHISYLVAPVFILKFFSQRSSANEVFLA